MKTIYSMALLAICCVVMAGCGEKETKEKDDAKNETQTTAVSLEQDTCAMCGEGGCDSKSCKTDAEKCDCGFHKGSALCCVDKDLKPTAGVYCKSCGHIKGTDKCCDESAASCDCGMHKGSPLCCKLGEKDGDEGHDHDHDEEGHDHDHDDDKGHDKDEAGK